MSPFVILILAYIALSYANELSLDNASAQSNGQPNLNHASSPTEGQQYKLLVQPPVEFPPLGGVRNRFGEITFGRTIGDGSIEKFYEAILNNLEEKASFWP